MGSHDVQGHPPMTGSLPRYNVAAARVARLGCESQVGHRVRDLRGPLLVGARDSGVYALAAYTTWNRS